MVIKKSREDPFVAVLRFLLLVFLPDKVSRKVQSFGLRSGNSPKFVSQIRETALLQLWLGGGRTHVVGGGVSVL